VARTAASARSTRLADHDRCNWWRGSNS